MYIFLIVFLSLYGGLHLYAFIRVREAFGPGRKTMAIIAGWMLLMTIAPLLVRLAEAAGLEQTALRIAWPAYIWMGSLFIFTSALVATDSVRAAAWLSQRFLTVTTPGFLSPGKTCKLALMAALAASAYALYEAGDIRTEYVTIFTDKLPPNTRNIRLVQISDVHIGLLFRESRLESVLQAVRGARPDILVSTGDLLDGRLSREYVVSRLDLLATMIADVPTPGGKYAVTGNHEYYAGMEQPLEFTRKAGFTTLRNQSVSLPGAVSIIGVDDIAWERMKMPPPARSERELVNTAPAESFRVMLKHRPVVEESGNGLIDLQLSGHVHKGQLFPFNLLVRMQFHLPCGTTRLHNGSIIHVSRGSGTWGPPMRLFAPPEVTVIDIRNVKAAEGTSSRSDNHL